MLKKISRLEPEPSWNFAAALSTLIGLFLALIIGSTLAQTIFGSEPITPIIGWTAGATLAIIFVLVTRRRTPEDVQSLRLDPTDVRLPLVALFAIGMAVTIDVVGLFITGDFWIAPELFSLFSIAEDNTVASLDNSLIVWIIAFIFMAFLQPVAEELVFRGVIYPAARAALGAWTGFSMTVILYGLFHVLAYLSIAPTDFTRVWYGLLVPLVDGLIITTVRGVTGSTRAAIVAHAAFGAFAVLKAFTLTG